MKVLVVHRNLQWRYSITRLLETGSTGDVIEIYTLSRITSLQLVSPHQYDLVFMDVPALLDLPWTEDWITKTQATNPGIRVYIAEPDGSLLVERFEKLGCVSLTSWISCERELKKILAEIAAKEASE